MRKADQGSSILFVFTNYGKLIRNDFISPGFLEYDSNTLLHPEAFEIMKKLWELDNQIVHTETRWYNGLQSSGIIDFFKNIVNISNTLRENDMKLYELKKEVDKCEKERIEETETMIINYENIIRDQNCPPSRVSHHIQPDDNSEIEEGGVDVSMLLEAIKNGESDVFENLSDIQKELLECLGLL